MYSINKDTGKIFLTSDNSEVLLNTIDYTNYIDWLSNDNTPTETDYKPINDDVSKKKYKNKIENAFSYLYIRALASSMNKSRLDLEFLNAQREVYQDKYDVSKGNIISGVLYDNTLELIQQEMADEFTEAILDALLPQYGITPEGTHLNKMFQLIIFKFEYGYNEFSQYKKFMEHFRTKCFTWSDSGTWNKIDEALTLVDNVPDSLTLTEAETLYNDFNAI